MAALAPSTPALAPNQARQRRNAVLRALLLSPIGLLMIGLYGYALLIFTGYSFFTFEAGQLRQELTLATWTEYLTDSFYWSILQTTLQLALTVTFFSIVIGYPLAYFLSRLKSSTARQWLSILIFAPLLVSVVVRAYGWLILLGRGGLVNYALVNSGILDEPLRLTQNFTGVVIATVHVLLPFACFPILSVLTQIEPSLKEASSDLGASRWRTFWEITFPMSMPGVVAAAQIVFPLSLSAFITPVMLGGGRVQVLSQIIYQSTVNLNWPVGAVAGAVLIVFTMLGLLALESVSRRFFGAWR